MSEKDKNIHDPLIDTVQSDEENEETDPTARPVSEQSEQADTVHDMGSYNGDSLAVSGSPFKKSYSTTSLGEASVDSLVDEPLPIESVALSPFRIDSIHNSSLPSRQKDSHTFSVSVSDSLPPHVMELDSPERIDEQEESDFCEDKVPPMEEEDDFFTEEKNISEPPMSRVESPPENLDSLLISSEDAQKQKAQWEKPEDLPPKQGTLHLSQEDMFESQSTEDKLVSSSFATFEKNSELYKGVPSSCKLTEDDALTDEDIIPSSEEPRYPKEVLHPFSGEILKEAVPQSPGAASPVKRKREILEENKSFEEQVHKKDRKESKVYEEVDSDVEILDSGPPSVNQSIEVVYDKKVFDSENMESQDLNLILTGDTQPVMEKRHFASNPLKNEKKSSQSQSLISISDSDNLICKDTYSSFEENAPVESTIRSTQVELLCKPASPSSQPNIESLINSPILRNKEASEGSKSTNESSCSNRSEVVATTSPSHLDTQELIETHSSNRDSNTAVSYPYFDTPCQISQESQEGLESVFVKAQKAAEKLREEEKQEKMKQCNKTASKKASDSFDTPPQIVEVKEIHQETPQQSLNGTPDSYSNNFTPVCAINPTRSSQSTPISSQVTTEASTRWLFSKISHEHNNSNSDRELSQKSQISVIDSDEEESKSHKNSDDQSKITKLNKKAENLASTPNDDSNNVSPNMTKEGGGTIIKDSHLNSTVDSFESNSLNQNNMELSKADTENLEVENDSIHCIKDLLDGGWTKVGMKTIECWMSPVTKEMVFTLEGEEIIKESATFGSVFSFFNKNSSGSSSSKDSRRISDVSSISRVTTSSSGYLGDKSSSSNQTNSELVRMESTRLSMASVYSISPPRPCLPNKCLEIGSSKADSELTKFTHPLPVSSVIPKVSKISIETQTDFELSSTSTSDESNVKYKYYRGRGRPRGRNKSKGRGIEVKSVSIPTPIKENSENLGPDAVPVVEIKEVQSKEEYEDDFYSLLPPFLQEKLKNAHIPLTEDEEEIFILQRNQMNKDEQKAQFEEVLRKVRIAQIKPGSLVFARYIDKNYYSAVVNDWVKEDRWQVQYSLDECVNVVREVYILPTEILPKGIACHVRHPKQKFSDPGIVKGHLYENSILTHIIEIHKGDIVKATHSHIILSPEVAKLFMEPRLIFNSMIASPGGDVSLDNIVPGKRRREKSSSPQKRIQATLSSPRYRKADSNLDSSEPGKESKRKQSKARNSTKSSSVPTAFSETSESNDFESSPPQSPSNTHKSSKKRKASKVSRTKVSDSAKKESPKTPHSTSKTRSGRSTKLSKTKQDGNVVGKSSKQLFASQEGKSKNVENLPEPLMNPVVELIQLEEVSPSPSSSPKNTPKTKGRKGGLGSATKNPKKSLKMEDEHSTGEDLVKEIDPRLGPLPPLGCQLFRGYSILITHKGNPSHTVDEEESSSLIPLDKEHLKDQILGGGGQVIETFEEANKFHIQSLQSKKSSSVQEGENIHNREALPSSKSPAKVLCISNSSCRTAKFIQCLTVGIPLVSSAWIIFSLKQDVCLNWLKFLLPAGMSLLTGNLMEQSINDYNKDAFSTVGKVVDVLEGEKVFLATSSNPEFGELWLNLLTVAKAAVFRKPPKRGNLQRLIDRRTSVVIADVSIPDEELKRAKEVNAPVVSSEWFIQSLIASCKLQYDAHPEFNYAHKLHKNTHVEGGEGNSSDNYN